MILDTLSNADKYRHLHPHFAQAFDYIKSLNLEEIEVGKYEIDGKDIHASVSLKDGYKAEDAKFEAHNNYIDIQVCPSYVCKVVGTDLQGCFFSLLVDLPFQR